MRLGLEYKSCEFVVFTLEVVSLPEEDVTEFLTHEEGHSPANSQFERVRNGQDKGSGTQSSDSPSKSKQNCSNNQLQVNLSMRVLHLLTKNRVLPTLSHLYPSERITLKVRALMSTPVMSTNSRLGSQLELN